MGKRFDRRIAFLKAVQARKIMPTLVLANEWFEHKKAWTIETEEALRQFKDALASRHLRPLF
jgi:hypothetical protein